MSDTAVKVENLDKVYKLYDRPVDRIKESLGFSKKKYHKDHYALNNISFEIKKGDTVGIIGENGAGKSTLLKIITGVLSPTNGNVRVNGKISALLELGAGFNPEYTGIENIYLNGTVMGFSKSEMDMKLEKIIDFADIGEFIYQPVKTYSSGMFVRLAFAVAVSIEPDILIVDEALSVGDAYFQAKSMTKMKELFDKGKTVIFVTHDTSTVKSLCKKAIYIEYGIMIDMGPSNEIVDLYERKVRESMIKSNRTVIDEEKSIDIEVFKKGNNIVFNESEEFARKVSHNRQGLGNARVMNLQLLDIEDKNIEEVKFNQKIKIRLYVKFIKDCTISVGYHIRDNKNIELLGSNTVFEGLGEIKGKSGEKLIIDFITNVPIIEGLYNISTVLSKTTIHNRSAIFEDYTQDGKLFRVLENEDCKIWNQVYVKNELSIFRK